MILSDFDANNFGSLENSEDNNRFFGISMQQKRRFLQEDTLIPNGHEPFGNEEVYSPQYNTINNNLQPIHQNYPSNPYGQPQNQMN